MRYIVVTPPYTTYYGEWEPPEYGSDVVEVEARTKHEAKIKAVREFRRTKSQWIQDAASDERSPFTGLKAYSEEDELE